MTEIRKANTGRKNAGMPPLPRTKNPTSFFEFWPTKLFYTPVAIFIAMLSAWYRGFTKCTLANPKFPNGGFVGEHKSGIFEHFSGHADDVLASWHVCGPNGETPEKQSADAIEAIKAKGFSLPCVAKPEIACRGRGVRLIEKPSDLEEYFKIFPKGENFLLQEFIDKEGEAGVFYIRYPGEDKGQIFSLTLKYFPYVVGDGKSTLEQLIKNDWRAGPLQHIYLPRHAERLDMVLEEGAEFRIAFTGSHSGGTVFRNGADYITDAMRDGFDKVADGIDEFYFGRFDVRFDDIKDLQNGEGFRILEINGGTGEATHIWDADTTIKEAYGSQFAQYGHLWKIGAINAKRGFKATSMKQIIAAWQHEKYLMQNYPFMD